ncbi:MAG: glycosyltransferase [Bacteroidetes bacterium]|nr:glycosyltransferase [Bacteroidota bacterium]
MIWLLAPVFNESENVSALIKSVSLQHTKGLPFAWIVVDDGSKDATVQTARQNLHDEDVIIELHNNRGPGKAFEAGMHYFLEYAKKDDLLLTLEGDGTADLESLAEMLHVKHEKNADLVLASVYLQGGGFSRTSALRLLISHAANALSRFWLGMPYRTLTSFYRLWTFSALERLHKVYQPLIDSPGFICQVELLYKSHLLQQQIFEVPTRVYSERRKGNSKMKLIKTALSHIQFLLQSRKYRK